MYDLNRQSRLFLVGMLSGMGRYLPLGTAAAEDGA
jgi:hypothetical protein